MIARSFLSVPRDRSRELLIAGALPEHSFLYAVLYRSAHRLAAQGRVTLALRLNG